MRYNYTNLKKLFDEILDKKFSKNMVAGYDPLEVDMFLDNIRGYLVNVNKTISELEQTIRNKETEINKLQQKINSKDDLIKKHQYTIDSLIKDGYRNQHFAKELGDLRATISELKNGKK